jgi:hypothetical protein
MWAEFEWENKVRAWFVTCALIVAMSMVTAVLTAVVC